MKSAFEKQLESLMKGDNPEEVEKNIDGLEGDDEETREEQKLLPVEFEKKETSLSEFSNKDKHQDYEFARSNYYGLIGRSNAALEMILQIAQMSEHPRAIEVAASLMKTSGDLTKDLLALQKSIEKDNVGAGGNKEQPPGSYTQINNTNYYGQNKEKEVKDAKDFEDALDGFDDIDDKE